MRTVEALHSLWTQGCTHPTTLEFRKSFRYHFTNKCCRGKACSIQKSEQTLICQCTTSHSPFISTGTMLRSTKALTWSSVPLAKEPRVTVASILICIGIMLSPTSCNNLGTIPWAITWPFWRLLPITEFFKHLEYGSNRWKQARFEVLTVTLLTVQVSWDVRLCFWVTCTQCFEAL